MKLPLAILLGCLTTFASGQTPAETVGLENIARALVSKFQDVDVLAISDTHWREVDSRLRLAVVRSPEFARRVRFILVEFGNTQDQPILDRYIRGENISPTELRRVWSNTCCAGTWDSPVYAEFFSAVREINRDLPPDRKIRVLGGDPPQGTPTTERDRSAAAVLRAEILEKGKALIIYGSGHLGYNNEMPQAVRAARGQDLYVVEVLGGTEQDFQSVDLALKSASRPVLFSVDTPAFVRLGNSMAHAFVYFGSGAEADRRIRPEK